MRTGVEGWEEVVGRFRVDGFNYFRRPGLAGHEWVPKKIWGTHEHIVNHVAFPKIKASRYLFGSLQMPGHF
jgi:hypothetical protein